PLVLIFLCCVCLCLDYVFFFLRPPPPRSTLFPYTTLFRSWRRGSTDMRRRSRLRDSTPITSRRRVSSSAASRATSPELPCTFWRSEEHTSELQSRSDLVCRLLLEKKKKKNNNNMTKLMPYV